MEFFGMSTFETLSVIVAVGGTIFWAGGIYRNVKQGKDDLSAMRKDLHKQAVRIDNHEIRLVRVEDKIGVAGKGSWDDIETQGVHE